MGMTGALKRKWYSWLEKVSASNKKQFGEKVPDCCNLLNKERHGGHDHSSVQRDK